MKVTYILAILVILMLAGCAKQAEMPEEQEPVAPETSEPEPVAPESEPEVESESETTAPEGDVIILRDMAAEPADVTIQAGGEVTFKNEAEKRPHMIIVEELSEQSDRIEIGETFSFIFEKPGVYNYRDLWVGSLRGTITVE